MKNLFLVFIKKMIKHNGLNLFKMFKKITIKKWKILILKNFVVEENAQEDFGWD